MPTETDTRALTAVPQVCNRTGRLCAAPL